MTQESVVKGLFDRLVREDLAPELLKTGFTRKGSKFVSTLNDGWALIEFQKSVSNSKRLLRFTINLGVVLRRLRTDASELKLPAIPDCREAQWNDRIGFFMTPAQDKWWEIYPGVSLDSIRSEISSVLHPSAIAEVLSLTSEMALLRYWERGKYGGLTEFQRHDYLERLRRLNLRK